MVINFAQKLLETKYPQLCELCSSLNNNCEYNIDDDIDTSLPLSHHIQALKCLMDKGQIAYVSRQEVQTFFSPVKKLNSKFDCIYLN